MRGMVVVDILVLLLLWLWSSSLLTSIYLFSKFKKRLQMGALDEDDASMTSKSISGDDIIHNKTYGSCLYIPDVEGGQEVASNGSVGILQYVRILITRAVVR